MTIRAMGLLYSFVLLCSILIFTDCVGTEYDVFISNGVIVRSDSEFSANIGILDGKITYIGLEEFPAKKSIDATGKYVLPGGIDPHVHLQLHLYGTVTSDDFYTGTRAALSGGTTFVMNFAVSDSLHGSLIDAYNLDRSRADNQVCCDYGFHSIITDWNNNTKEEMKELVNSLGVTSFKFFTAYKDMLMVNDDEIIDIVKTSRDLGAIPQSHCENGDIVAVKQTELLEKGFASKVAGHPLSRDAEVEAEATGRVLRIAEEMNAPIYIVHVMSSNALDEIKRAKQRNQRVIGETLVTALTLDECPYFSDDWDEGAKYVCSPPLRDKSHQQEMLTGISDGSLDLVASDHCAWTMKQRYLGHKDFTKIPNGNPSIEDRMNVLWTILVKTNIITRQQYVNITSTRAARIFGVYPQKGEISVGSDADIAIMNPDLKKVISAKSQYQNVDYNVFEGMELHGVIDTTIARGKVVWENGVLNTTKGMGKFVPTKPFSSSLYDGFQEWEKERSYSEIMKRKQKECKKR